MKCEHCGEEDNSKVKATRLCESGAKLRRRLCLGCDNRFKAYEITDNDLKVLCNGDEEKYRQFTKLLSFIDLQRLRKINAKGIDLCSGCALKVAVMEARELTEESKS